MMKRAKFGCPPHTAHRSRQAEIVTQRRTLVFRAEQTARLQFRYDEIDELVQPAWQMGWLDQEASTARLSNQACIPSTISDGVPLSVRWPRAPAKRS